jgi:hypothetical protein
LWLVGLVMAIVAAATVVDAVPARGQVVSVDMRVLVIAADGTEPEYGAITNTLERIGVPFDTLFAASAPLTTTMLTDSAGNGNYSAIVLTSGHLWYYDAATNSYPSAFTLDEWYILEAYERDHQVRSATLFTYSGGWPSYGLAYTGYQDTTPAVGGTLTGTLTPAGSALFDYLNTPTIDIAYAWTYFGTVVDPAATTSLLNAPDGTPLIYTTTYADGRQNLALGFGNNNWGVHSKLVLYGVVDWVTRGVFLGARHATIGTQIDDLLIPSDMWDTAAMSDTTGLEYRLTSTDWANVRAWQQSVRNRYPTTADFTIEWAYNGEGAGGRDPLTRAIGANPNDFTYVNHTFTHLNMDNVSYRDANRDISRNRPIPARYGFSATYVTDSLVNPDISGLDNPNFHRAVVDNGIQYVISDVSRAGWGNPTPNTGIQSRFQPSLLIVPRRANNLFYNLRTPAEWVSEYNCFYGPTGTCAGGAFRFWSANLTYEQILEVESNQILTYLLDWDIDPLMFHQANLGTYSGTRSLFGDLMDEVFRKYAALVDLPIRSLTQSEIGNEMRARKSYDTSGVTATITPCSSMTMVSPVAVTVPVTGVSHGSNVEHYADETISYIPLQPNVPVTVPVQC